MGRVWPKRKNGKESPERQYNKTDDQPELLFRQPPEAAEWYGSQREQLVWTVRDLTIGRQKRRHFGLHGQAVTTSGANRRNVRQV